MSGRHKLLVATLLLAALPLASAADQKKDIARCVAEKDDVKRLECFDALGRRLGVAEPKKATTSVSKWTIKRERSPLDDSLNVTLSLSAQSSISGWPGVTHRPKLILRCKEKTTDAYVVTGMPPDVEYGTDDTTVTVRLDKKEALQYRTSKSTDGEALFFEPSISFIKSLLEHDTMLFKFTPFNSSPAMTTFDVRGLAQALKPLQEACSWQTAAAGE